MTNKGVYTFKEIEFNFAMTKQNFVSSGYFISTTRIYIAKAE